MLRQLFLLFDYLFFLSIFYQILFFHPSPGVVFIQELQKRESFFLLHKIHISPFLQLFLASIKSQIATNITFPYQIAKITNQNGPRDFNTELIRFECELKTEASMIFPAFSSANGAIVGHRWPYICSVQLRKKWEKN